MIIFNKFVWSKKEPENKRDIWFDGSNLRIYTEGSWEIILQGFMPLSREFSNEFSDDFAR